jgi:hypothetical protein
MKLIRVGLFSLACVGGAFAFGMVANSAIDLVIPAPARTVTAQAEAAQPVAYALASTTSTPTDIAPTKVKTIPMLFREERAEREQMAELVAPRGAAVPLPRPRPAGAPAMAIAHATEVTASLSRQPGSLAISAATRKGAHEDTDLLGSAGIERMKTALALTAEQEEYWPAIAAELRAVGKLLAQKNSGKGPSGKISVDNESMQRLYWAAAPLITRLSYEQKAKAKQMARLMGLNEVAEAL